ncbi:phosphatidate cytidylyltransferase [Rugamonas sp.]|uniref:phosphatidate cytidylyltransferase n=1 Tax=Rugamonas sp. TaxID=1926287 RepID=UPI0025F71285|nr:phosphatidate cytidylyltransferase [Rugamonas sp.]
MLKTRILTALVLLAVLLPVLFFNNFGAFALVATLFFGAAAWEAARLFGIPAPRVFGVVCCVVFLAGLVAGGAAGIIGALFALSVLLWLIRFTPSLAIGLPALGTPANWALSLSFTFALFGCFYAIVRLFQHSPEYLLSVMALVWIADIGAYFSGKAFGKRKLAPTISPGKSWEGAIGGGIAVLALSALTIAAPASAPWLQDTFAVHLQTRFGWAGALAILAVIVAASVVGDLFESQLKRRAAMKDSSSLLPGHGGVLDRIDALIPVLPLAALIGVWL